MGKENKTYRIRTEVGAIGENSYFLPVQLDQDYDTLEILSLKINQNTNAYDLHTADYGVVVGRVIANGGVGVPNAKISIFVTKDSDEKDRVINTLYPYMSYRGRNKDNIRYNLLTDTTNDTNASACHQVVGTFPSKKMVLDDDNYVEVFEKYYKYTTKTNDSGDYMIFGVPTGNQTLHMDLDISDCGILSQRPRDFVYKGYNIEQFENPNQFKVDTELDALSQIFTQNQTVSVLPFWGDSSVTNNVGITRADVNVNFKFETTCVFMGSVFTDDANNGISKKCVPSKEMGKMNKLTTGRGTIEIIRKTPGGSVEELSIKGTDLIDGSGVWCFQIPMNLDYMMTDEYGNLVPTDDPDKGIATRAKVRFRISMGSESDSAKYFQTKVLVPNNPEKNTSIDDEGNSANHYTFGTYTLDEDYRDLFWNCVYSVKSFIPRIQRQNVGNKRAWRTKKFSGIKTCNVPDANNPFPYNHIRLKFPFLFVMLCALLHTVVWAIELINKVITIVGKFIYKWNQKKVLSKIFKITMPFKSYVTLSDDLCPDMDSTFVAPGAAIEGSSTAISTQPYVKDLVAGTYTKLNTDNFGSQTGDSYTVIGGDEKTEVYNLLDNDPDKIDAVLVRYRIGTFEKYLYLAASGTKEYFDTVKQGIDDIIEDFAANGTINSKLKKWGVGDFKKQLCYTASTLSDSANDWRWVGSGSTPSSFDNKKLKSLISEIQKTSTDSFKSSNDTHSTDAKNKSYSAEDETPKICLTNKTSYLMQCVEMNLAEEYEVINFDFYNDWVNGSIYMPRWARQIKKYGKKKERVKGCFNSSFKKDRYVVSFGNFNSSATDAAEYKRRWNEKGVSRTVFGNKGGLINESVNMQQLKIYYFKPCEWNNNQKSALLFATDIILLGHLDECNIFGIPKVSTGMDSTSYKLPPDMVETNLMTDGQEYSAGGCIDVSKISTATTAQLFNAFSATTDTNIAFNTIVSGKTINEELVSATEEAGISWEITGPNQFWRDKDELYSPGGHFLALACSQDNSSTNAKSIINAERICEVGVTTSQRKEIEQANGSTMYIVPTGFISKDEIVDDEFRINFASMNNATLRATKRVNSDVYPRYDFQYVTPTGFDGRGKGLIGLSGRTADTENNQYVYSSVNESGNVVVSATTGTNPPKPYNAKLPWNRNNMAVTPYYSIQETDNDASELIRQETANTYTRTWESKDEEYVSFRWGKTINRMMPLNSFYFYFGLKNGDTAVERMKEDFFAVCAKSTDADYEGVVVATYNRENGENYVYEITTEDVQTPFTISIYNELGNELEPSGKTYVYDNEDLEMNTYSGNPVENYSGTSFYLKVPQAYNIMLSIESADGHTISKVIGKNNPKISVTYDSSDFILFEHQSAATPENLYGLSRGSKEDKYGRKINFGGYVTLEGFDYDEASGATEGTDYDDGKGILITGPDNHYVYWGFEDSGVTKILQEKYDLERLNNGQSSGRDNEDRYYLWGKGQYDITILYNLQQGDSDKWKESEVGKINIEKKLIYTDFKYTINELSISNSEMRQLDSTGTTLKKIPYTTESDSGSGATQVDYSIESADTSVSGIRYITQGQDNEGSNVYLIPNSPVEYTLDTKPLSDVTLVNEDSSSETGAIFNVNPDNVLAYMNNGIVLNQILEYDEFELFPENNSIIFRFNSEDSWNEAKKVVNYNLLSQGLSDNYLSCAIIVNNNVTEPIFGKFTINDYSGDTPAGDINFEIESGLTESIVEDSKIALYVAYPVIYSHIPVSGTVRVLYTDVYKEYPSYRSSSIQERGVEKQDYLNAFGFTETAITPYTGTSITSITESKVGFKSEFKSGNEIFNNEGEQLFYQLAKGNLWEGKNGYKITGATQPSFGFIWNQLLQSGLNAPGLDIEEMDAGGHSGYYCQIFSAESNDIKYEAIYVSDSNTTPRDKENLSCTIKFASDAYKPQPCGGDIMNPIKDGSEYKYSLITGSTQTITLKWVYSVSATDIDTNKFSSIVIKKIPVTIGVYSATSSYMAFRLEGFKYCIEKHTTSIYPENEYVTLERTGNVTIKQQIELNSTNNFSYSFDVYIQANVTALSSSYGRYSQVGAMQADIWTDIYREDLDISYNFISPLDGFFTNIDTKFSTSLPDNSYTQVQIYCTTYN